jgi:hypothetical protein
MVDIDHRIRTSWRTAPCFATACSILFSLIAVPGLHAADPENGKNADEGWTDLLADNDLTQHWTTRGNWKIDDDGVVTLRPREGERGWARFDAYLWAKRTYDDFEIEFEYRVEKGGNSGFYFNVGDVGSPVEKGIEVQIHDAPGKPDQKPTDHDSGGIIPGIPPTKRTAKKPGEWNKMRVTVKENNVKVELNGEVVNDVPLDSKSIKDRPKSGHIGFQDHGLPLWLRNIKVREL